MLSFWSILLDLLQSTLFGNKRNRLHVPNKRKTSTQKFKQCMHVANGGDYTMCSIFDIFSSWYRPTSILASIVSRSVYRLRDALCCTRTNGNRERRKRMPLKYLLRAGLVVSRSDATTQPFIESIWIDLNRFRSNSHPLNYNNFFSKTFSFQWKWFQWEVAERRGPFTECNK